MGNPGYNRANLLRTLAIPRAIERWSLTSLRERLIKTDARLVLHGRYALFQLAEAAVPRAVFVGIPHSCLPPINEEPEECPSALSSP